MFKITRHALHRSLKAALRLTSDDETRPQLCGVGIRFVDGRPQFIGANSHALVKACPLVEQTENTESDGLITILANANAKELAKQVRPSKSAERVEVCDVAFVAGRSGLCIDVTWACGAARHELETALTFPPVDQVIPARRDSDATSSAVFALNPWLVADVMTAVTDFFPLSKRKRSGSLGTVWSREHDLDPCRLDASHNDYGAIVAVIMPMRLPMSMSAAE